MTLPFETGHDRAHETDPNISPLKVMSTPAGYYLGTEYFDKDLAAWLPNSRETNYMYREQALAALATYHASGNEHIPNERW